MSAPRMQELYDNTVVKALNEEFKYSNPHQVPQLVKIVANMGLGEAVQNPKIIEGAQKELSQLGFHISRYRKSFLQNRDRGRGVVNMKFNSEN